MATGHAERSRAESGQYKKTYAKRISDNIAYALIVYTMMLIFLVAGAIKTSSLSVFPYLLLLLFVAVVIPMARRFEKKWEMLDASELSDNSLNTRFNLDRLKLWVGTIILPLFLTLVCKQVSGLL